MANKYRDAGGASNGENQMRKKTLFRDRRGTSAVEFALTLPVFILMLFGLWQICHGLWAQFALQHGAEMAARCMTINPPPAACSTTASIQSYAASQSYGFSPPPATFSVSKNTTCGNQISGNQISADYAVSPAVANIGIPALNLHAQACYAS
jgi:Flp pilus assembly protein TadG